MKQSLLKRAYRQAIRLYPAPYRRRFGDEMRQTLDDALEHSRRPRRIWIRAFGELPAGLTREYASNIKEAIMESPLETKSYQRTFFIGLTLLVPLASILAGLIVFNSLYPGRDILSTSVGHYVYARWTSWVFGLTLPTIALILNTVPVVKQLSHHRWQIFAWSSYRLVLLNITFLVIVGGFITLLFGHDSIHCVAHNPINLVRHLNQVTTCLKTSG